MGLINSRILELIESKIGAYKQDYLYSEPFLLEIHLNKRENSVLQLALVGKGITFDMGGTSVKGYKEAYEMRNDMGGAAICSLAILAANVLQNHNSDLVAKIHQQKFAAKRENSEYHPPHIVCLLPLTENMLGGNSTKPFDVIQSHSGQTVCIHDADAEGRLVMADTISYANKNLKAENIVDIATLTGSVEKALGNITTGCWNKNFDSKLFSQLEASGYKTCERFHQLPLYEFHLERLTDCPYADIYNYLHETPDATNAATFLSTMCDHENFMHIDVGGSMETKIGACQYLSQDAWSGRPVRAIIDFILSFY